MESAQNINAWDQRIITKQNPAVLTIQVKKKIFSPCMSPAFSHCTSFLKMLDKFHILNLIEEAYLSNPFSQWTDRLEKVERNFLLMVSFVGFKLKE